MSFSMSQRILPWFGFVQIILLFRGVSLLQKNVKWYFAVPAAALVSGYVVYRISSSPIVAGETLILAVVAAALFIVLWAALRAGKNENTQRAFATVMVFFSLFSAGMVHPVQQGMAEVEESRVVQEIRAVTEQDPDGKWLVENLSYPYGMVPLMGGAPTINCVQSYPNLELWYKLDPEKDDEFAYNRYVSQVVTTLVTEPTTISVGWVDDIMDLKLNPDDLKTMEVSYILTNRYLTDFETDTVHFAMLTVVNGFAIYRVEYAEQE